MSAGEDRSAAEAEPAAEAADANPLWGGRFAAGQAEVMERINASIDFDRRLYAQDIRGSQAHCRMLVRQGILTDQDGEAIVAGLDTILREIEAGGFQFEQALEDIHMNIEARLKALIGEAAGRLHTARSRNDQVATDFRLWVRDEIDALDGALQALQAALIDQAEANADAIMPGYTHLQAAQPVTLGHHLMAYVEMIGRDRGRFADARKRLNESPLGAAALAGTSFPIDRDATAAALGFEGPMANSIDAVSDRDFALEFLAAGSILAVHLSRLAEELVLWCNAGFGFVALSDAYTTGSSIMPQKRNPDAAELVRGKAGRVIGALNTLLTVMKGLPLAYGKDMQEDKEPVFDCADTLALCVSRDDRHAARPGGRPRGTRRGHRGRLHHRNRPRRLAGTQPRPAVPRRSPGHRRDRPARRDAGLSLGGTAPSRAAGGRAADHRLDLRGAERRAGGGQPDQPRRHRARAGSRGGGGSPEAIPMSATRRLTLLILAAALLGLGPIACGKRGSPGPPEGLESEYTYPKAYPAPVGVLGPTRSEEPAEEETGLRPGDSKLSTFPTSRTKTTTYGPVTSE